MDSGQKEMPATGIEDNSSLKVPVVTSTDTKVINNLDKAIEKQCPRQYDGHWRDPFGERNDTATPQDTVNHRSG